MTIKEFLISRVQLFFLLTTLILAASAIIGAVIAPAEELHYYQLFGPMAFAGLCVLPTCVSFFRKEPTLGQFIIRKAIELVLIECIILFIISPPDDDSIPALLFYVILGAVVLVIYDKRIIQTKTAALYGLRLFFACQSGFAGGLPSGLFPPGAPPPSGGASWPPDEVETLISIASP